MTELKNPNDPASEKQLSLIAKLAFRLSEEMQQKAHERMDQGLTKGQASNWIEKLMKMPNPEPEGDLADVVAYLREKEQNGKLDDFTGSLLSQYETWGSLSEKQMKVILGRLEKRKQEPKLACPIVPSGRYAVELDGAWELFRVWHGKRADVQHLYAVKGTERGERVVGPDELAALTEIAKDPGKAALEFGHRTGHCSRCGAELENNLSRKLGVGPVCLKHWYSSNDSNRMRKVAREELRAAGLEPDAKHDSLATV